MDNDIRFMKYVVNVLIPFPVILAQAGIKNVSYEGNIFCPFHENTNTPSAKMFKNKTGDTIYCYAERKVFHPSDVCGRGMIPQTIEVLFQRLWNKLSDKDKEMLKAQFSNPIEMVPSKWTENKDMLLLFKNGAISFQDHLLKLVESC